MNPNPVAQKLWPWEPGQTNRQTNKKTPNAGDTRTVGHFTEGSRLATGLLPGHRNDAWRHACLAWSDACPATSHAWPEVTPGLDLPVALGLATGLMLGLRQCLPCNVARLAWGDACPATSHAWPEVTPGLTSGFRSRCCGVSTDRTDQRLKKPFFAK